MSQARIVQQPTYFLTSTDSTREPLERARADSRRRMKSRAGSFFKAISNLPQKCV
jgi:hypothetical protein